MGLARDLVFLGFWGGLRVYGLGLQVGGGGGALGFLGDFGFMSLGFQEGGGAQVLKKEQCRGVFVWIQARMHDREHAEVRWL